MVGGMLGASEAGREALQKRLDNAAAEALTDPAAGSDYLSTPYDDTLTQSKYDFTYRVFPSDLGEQNYNGHYMVININVQNGTRFNGTVINDNGNSIKTFTRLEGELSKVDALKQYIDEKWKTSDGQAFNNIGVIPRQTRRIVESIALYMPNTVVFDTNNDYEDVGLTDIGKGFGSGVIQTASGFATKAVGKAIGGVLSGVGSVAGTGGKLLQRPINPRIEVLFKNTIQRTFQFDFLFAPECIEDSIAMRQIIKTLRFHAAPEYVGDLLGVPTASLLYIPPSEFDITFYNRGRENSSIPRINTCALTKINVDYAPQGIYSTFTNGSPVSARLQLEFRELEVVSKLRVLQGF